MQTQPVTGFSDTFFEWGLHTWDAPHVYRKALMAGKGPSFALCIEQPTVVVLSLHPCRISVSLICSGDFEVCYGSEWRLMYHFQAGCKTI